MKETLEAFSNPSWWVLTVVVGLALNVFAPFINKRIESFWASRSTRKAEEVARSQAALRDAVERMKLKPTGLLEAKANATYFAVLVVLKLSVYLMLVQLAFALPTLIPAVELNLVAIPIVLAGFLSITGQLRQWRTASRLHNLMLESDGAQQL